MICLYYKLDLSLILKKMKKRGVAYDVSKKIAQGCQGGTRQILKVHTLNYYFQQKHCIYTQLDGHAIIFILSTRL